MTDNVTTFHTRKFASVQMQVTTADCRGCHFEQDIVGLTDHRPRYLFITHIELSTPNDSFHLLGGMGFWLLTSASWIMSQDSIRNRRHNIGWIHHLEVCKRKENQSEQNVCSVCQDFSSSKPRLISTIAEGIIKCILD